jgi:ComF family protein
VIHKGKYNHRRDLLTLLAVHACTLYKPPLKEYTVIPIPMTRTRKLLRGYNQSEVISNVVATTYKLPLELQTLTRNKTTTTQVRTKNRRARLSMQSDSFSASPSCSGKNILLVDDVATTGATLMAARKALLDAGARDVIALTIAH